MERKRLDNIMDFSFSVMVIVLASVFALMLLHHILHHLPKAEIKHVIRADTGNTSHTARVQGVVDGLAMAGYEDIIVDKSNESDIVVIYSVKAVKK